jgi:Protein kinase domain
MPVEIKQTMGEETPTMRMIKRLNEIIPTLSEEDRRAAEHELRRLQEANPLLSSDIPAAQTVAESWMQRDINRKMVLEVKLQKEKNLLRGYQMLSESGESRLAEERLELTRAKVFWLEAQIGHVEKFLKEVTAKSFAHSFSQEVQKGRKRSGKLQMQVGAIRDFSPINKNTKIKIYVDAELKKEMDGGEGNVFDEDVALDLVNNLEMEIVLVNSLGAIYGVLFFPVSDLPTLNGPKKLYPLIEDRTSLEVDFKECNFENKELVRYNAAIVSVRISGHKMVRAKNIGYMKCGVCEFFMSGLFGNTIYTCKECKFSCHSDCLSLIFFKCREAEKEERSREKEERRAKREKEKKEKEEKTKEERMAMVLSTLDVREHPEVERVEGLYREKSKELIESLKRRESEKVVENKEYVPMVPTKRYAVVHTLQEKPTLGAVWCLHCGLRIGMLEHADYCDSCGKVFHISCRKWLFSSCGVTPAFLKSLVAFVPPPYFPHGKGLCIDDFELLKVLGRGSFGKVLLARRGEELVALKIIRKTKAAEGNNAVYLEAERWCLEMARVSDNPFLLKSRGCFQSETHLFFVIEFISGGDLMHHAGQRVFSDEEIRFILAELVLALEFLHEKGVMYRDMKLDNIMISSDGHVRLADFGLCSLGKSVAYTFCGTLANVAPEVIAEEGYGKEADWWGLGVVAYQMILSEQPFVGNTPQELCESIANNPPQSLNLLGGETRDFVSRLLTKDPKKRLGQGGATEIKAHSYFVSIRWDDLFRKKVVPPWLPAESTEENFDREFTREAVQITPAPSVSETFDRIFVNFYSGK